MSGSHPWPCSVSEGASKFQPQSLVENGSSFPWEGKRAAPVFQVPMRGGLRESKASQTRQAWWPWSGRNPGMFAVLGVESHCQPQAPGCEGCFFSSGRRAQHHRDLGAAQRPPRKGQGQPHPAVPAPLTGSNFRTNVGFQLLNLSTSKDCSQKKAASNNGSGWTWPSRGHPTAAPKTLGQCSFLPMENTGL